MFFFIAHHQAGVGAVVFAIGSLIAIPLVRFRRPLAATGAVVAALLVVCADGLFGGGPADALVYRHGVTGETVEVERADDQSARRCRRLAQDVWRASETTDARHARLEQRPDYVAAVQAYLACGCGGEGRDVRALRKMQTAANDPRS